MTQFTKYVIADKIENGFRVMILEQDNDTGLRLVENIFELGQLTEVALFDDFNDIHYVSRGVGNPLQETGCLSLAEALECVAE